MTCGTKMSCTTTSQNTMLNAGNRWKDSLQADNCRLQSLGDLLLKAPERKPSVHVVDDSGDDQATLSTSPTGDSLSTLDDSVEFYESLDLLRFLESASTLDGRRYGAVDRCGPEGAQRRSSHRSDSYLVLPQLAAPENKHLRRAIRFAPRVEVQKYAVTVGDSPSCGGPCALSLDWSHTEATRAPYNDLSSRVVLPVRQLTTGERRRRVLQVNALDRDELRALELDLVSGQVAAIERELTGLHRGALSNMRTRWPGASDMHEKHT